MGLKVHNLNTDTFNIAFISNAVTPVTTTSDPRWGVGGGTNLSTDEQSGGNYTAGGIALTGLSWALATGLGKWDATDPAQYLKNASNPTALYYAVIYNNTAAGKQAALTIELGGPISGVVSDLTVSFNASGIATSNQA